MQAGAEKRSSTRRKTKHTGRTRWLKDQQTMASYAQLVFSVLASDLSKKDLLGMS